MRLDHDQTSSHTWELAAITKKISQRTLPMYLKRLNTEHPGHGNTRSTSKQARSPIRSPRTLNKIKSNDVNIGVNASASRGTYVNTKIPGTPEQGDSCIPRLMSGRGSPSLNNPPTTPHVALRSTLPLTANTQITPRITSTLLFLLSFQAGRTPSQFFSGELLPLLFSCFVGQ